MNFLVLDNDIVCTSLSNVELISLVSLSNQDLSGLDLLTFHHINREFELLRVELREQKVLLDCLANTLSLLLTFRNPVFLGIECCEILKLRITCNLLSSLTSLGITLRRNDDVGLLMSCLSAFLLTAFVLARLVKTVQFDNNHCNVVGSNFVLQPKLICFLYQSMTRSQGRLAILLQNINSFLIRDELPNTVTSKNEKLVLRVQRELSHLG